MAGNPKSRWSYRSVARLFLAVLYFPLLILLYFWWLLRARWGLRTSKRAGLQVLSTMDFSAMFNARSPVVLTDVVTQWPAFTKWTPEYMAATLGNQRVDVFVTSSGNVLPKFVERDYKTVQFDELIDIVFSKPPPGKLYYMTGKGLGVLKHLRQDLGIPDLADGRSLDELGTGLWIGHKGNVTSLHYDGWHGCLVQLWGKKRVTLFSPDDTCNLYQRSPFGGSCWISRVSGNAKDADESRFPNLRRAQGIEWILEPGQLLYIPPYWWHEAESLDNSMSLPLRYLPRKKESVSLMLAAGQLFSMVWTLRVRQPFNRVFNH